MRTGSGKYFTRHIPKYLRCPTCTTTAASGAAFLSFCPRPSTLRHFPCVRLPSAAVADSAASFFLPAYLTPLRYPPGVLLPPYLPCAPHPQRSFPAQVRPSRTCYIFPSCWFPGSGLSPTVITIVDLLYPPPTPARTLSKLTTPRLSRSLASPLFRCCSVRAPARLRFPRHHPMLSSVASSTRPPPPRTAPLSLSASSTTVVAVVLSWCSPPSSRRPVSPPPDCLLLPPRLTPPGGP